MGASGYSRSSTTEAFSIQSRILGGVATFTRFSRGLPFSMSDVDLLLPVLFTVGEGLNAMIIYIFDFGSRLPPELDLGMEMMGQKTFNTCLFAALRIT